LQARDSETHCATLTGWSGQGERSSDTKRDHSDFSRAVRLEVSTPGKVTSFVSERVGEASGELSPGERHVTSFVFKKPNSTRAEAARKLNIARRSVVRSPADDDTVLPSAERASR